MVSKLETFSTSVFKGVCSRTDCTFVIVITEHVRYLTEISSRHMGSDSDVDDAQPNTALLSLDLPR